MTQEVYTQIQKCPHCGKEIKVVAHSDRYGIKIEIDIPQEKNHTKHS